MAKPRQAPSNVSPAHDTHGFKGSLGHQSMHQGKDSLKSSSDTLGIKKSSTSNLPKSKPSADLGIGRNADPLNKQ